MLRCPTGQFAASAAVGAIGVRIPWGKAVALRGAAKGAERASKARSKHSTHSRSLYVQGPRCPRAPVYRGEGVTPRLAFPKCNTNGPPRVRETQFCKLSMGGARGGGSKPGLVVKAEPSAAEASDPEPTVLGDGRWLVL